MDRKRKTKIRQSARATAAFFRGGCSIPARDRCLRAVLGQRENDVIADQDLAETGMCAPFSSGTGI